LAKESQEFPFGRQLRRKLYRGELREKMLGKLAGPHHQPSTIHKGAKKAIAYLPGALRREIHEHVTAKIMSIALVLFSGEG